MRIYPSWMDKASLVSSGLDLPYYEAKFEHIISTLGEKHLSWWEHKGSNECRICDMFVIIINLLGQIDTYSTKSSLDSMNDNDYQDNCVLDQEPHPLQDK